jgi:hypothetical protein
VSTITAIISQLISVFFTDSDVVHIVAYFAKLHLCSNIFVILSIYRVLILFVYIGSMESIFCRETVGFPTWFPYKIDELFYPGIKNIFLSFARLLSCVY